jgi:hypothetical protein
MPYQLTQYPEYLRAVIGNGATADEFASFYRDVQLRCAELGLERALVVVVPGDEVPHFEDLGRFSGAGFADTFRLALICATWTLYQACNKAERTAARAGFQVRTFLQEMEGVTWLSNGPS